MYYTVYVFIMYIICILYSLTLVRLDGKYVFNVFVSARLGDTNTRICYVFVARKHTRTPAAAAAVCVGVVTQQRHRLSGPQGLAQPRMTVKIVRMVDLAYGGMSDTINTLPAR